MHPAHGQSQNGALSGAVLGLATIAAIILAIFLTPHCWPLVEGQAWRMLIVRYDHDVAVALHWCLYGLSYAIIWCGLRLALIFALTGAQIWFMRQLF